MAMLIDASLKGDFQPRPGLPISKQPFVWQGAPRSHFQYVQDLLIQS